MPTAHVTARNGRRVVVVANLVGLSFVPLLLGPHHSAEAFVVPTSSSALHAALASRPAPQQSSPLFLLPSQASELVEAASVQSYRDDDDDDEKTTIVENAVDIDESAMKADASWLWDVDEDVDAPVDRARSDEDSTTTTPTPAVPKGLVARVLSLPSSLIKKRSRDPAHIAVTKDDVVLFPVVGCRLVPEYHEDSSSKESPSNHRQAVVHVRSLPTVSNPSCRIRNFRDEEVVGWWWNRQQQQHQHQHDVNSFD